MLHNQIRRVAEKLDAIDGVTYGGRQTLSIAVLNLKAIAEDVECLEAHVNPQKQQEETHAA